MRIGLLVLLFLVGATGLAFLALDGGPAAVQDPLSGPPAADVEDRPQLAGRGVSLDRRPVDQLLEGLVDEESETVPEVAQALFERAQREPDLAMALVRRFREIDRWDTYREVDRLMRALAAMGEPGARAFLTLLEEPGTRAYDRATHYTGMFQEYGELLTPVLVAQMEGLGTRKDVAPWQVFGALEALGPSAIGAEPELLALLAPPLEDALVGGAASALVAIAGPTEATFAAIRGVLADPETAARSGVLGALVSLGPEAEPFLGELVALLEDPEAATRYAAARALAAIGKPTPEVLRELAWMLVDDHQKFAATFALSQLGADGAEVILETARTAEGIDTRIRALQGFSSMGGDLTRTVDLLLDILGEDVERGWKSQALYLLARLDPMPDDERVARALEGAIEDPVLRGAAYTALLRMPGDRGRRIVARRAREAADPGERLAAATALAALRQPAPEVAEAALGVLNADVTHTDRRNAFYLLMNANPPAGAAEGLPVLSPFLKSADGQERRTAMQAIVRLDGGAGELAPVYLGGLEDPWTRVAAVQALGTMPEAAARSVPTLVELAVGDATRGHVGGDVHQALKALRKHWSGTDAALDAAIADAAGEAKARLDRLREHVRSR